MGYSLVSAMAALPGRHCEGGGVADGDWAGPFLIDLASGEIRYRLERQGANRLDGDPRQRATRHLPWAVWDPHDLWNYFDADKAVPIPVEATNALAAASVLLARWFREP
jgi:hypothetical protein